VRTVGIRGDGDGGRILPEVGNEDEEYFRWCGAMSCKVSSGQSLPR
jgi:hypothetical protein